MKSNYILQKNCRVPAVRGAKERAREMQERYAFLSSLYEMMEGNGVVVEDDTRTAANMIAKVCSQRPWWYARYPKSRERARERENLYSTTSTAPTDVLNTVILKVQ